MSSSAMPTLPELEERILDFWAKEGIFEQSVEQVKDGKPFVFYDGPPFATGLPHYGHIMQMAFKDAVLRYKTMQGFRVPRKIGWDTHGLPVEYELEKELKISGKKEIVAFGIDKFVEEARGIVLRYTSQWESTMTRMGRWVDVSNPYATMDNEYIESVWWAFKSLNEKGLVYQDYRVSPYCPRCGTVLSNFEVNQGYKDNVADTSVYVRLKVTSGKFAGAFLVFWTTTPWTIPAVTAMSVNESLDYVLAQSNEDKIIVAKALLSQVASEATVLEIFKGSDLLGLTYESCYTVGEQAGLHRVVAGEHVTAESGTGIASIAPAYGEIDSQVGRRENLPMIQTVEANGTIKAGFGLPGEALFMKDANKAIIADLESKGRLLREEVIKHTYPFCWRCDTPLLYYPTTSWYVAVTKIKDELIAQNQEINWLPEHLRDGRFGKWLEGARDWAISRDRFWGAPLPIWECPNADHKDREPLIIGSIAELKEKAHGNVPGDLHRPYIDEVIMTCSCGAERIRVPFVFDCWFESGSMPYAQHHAPFVHKELFNPETGDGYPADFIAEALDQTRGWFYTLHVLGVALFGQKAYKNVVVSGLIQAMDGKKLSKRLRNYTAPEELFDSQGVDALRLFLFTSASIGEDYRFSDAAVQDVKRRWITPLLNTVNYYHLSLADKDDALPTQPHEALLDTWIKARVAEARAQVFEAMDGKGERSPFDMVRACRTFGTLVEDLSTWYVRLSRGRKDSAFTQTLQEVLVNISTTYAPFMPFVTEHIYQEVAHKAPEFPQSVHLCSIKPLVQWENSEVLDEMAGIRMVVGLGRELRAKQGVPLRQPVGNAMVQAPRALSNEGLSLVAQELQIESVVAGESVPADYTAVTDHDVTLAVDFTLTPELLSKGKANELRRFVQDLRKQAGLQASDVAHVTISGLSADVAKFLTPQLGQTQLVSTAMGEQVAQAKVGEEGLDITLYRP